MARLAQGDRKTMVTQITTLYNCGEQSRKIRRADLEVENSSRPRTRFWGYSGHIIDTVYKCENLPLLHTFFLLHVLFRLAYSTYMFIYTAQAWQSISHTQLLHTFVASLFSTIWLYLHSFLPPTCSRKGLLLTRYYLVGGAYSIQQSHMVVCVVLVQRF